MTNLEHYIQTWCFWSDEWKDKDYLGICKRMRNHDLELIRFTLHSIRVNAPEHLINDIEWRFASGQRQLKKEKRFKTFIDDMVISIKMSIEEVKDGKDIDYAFEWLNQFMEVDDDTRDN